MRMIKRMIMLCVSTLIISLGITLSSYASQNSIPKASADDITISNYISGTGKVLIQRKWENIPDGVDGATVEVSRVKDGKIVELTDYIFTVKIQKNVFYRYRMRYFVEEDNYRTVGEWSDYKYFYMPSISGKRTSNKVTIKWKAMPNVKSYDIYYYVAKVKGINTGKMTVSVASTSAQSKLNKTTYNKWKKLKRIGKKKTSITITKVGNKKLNKNYKYYFRVVPNQYVNGKKVENDLYTMIYR